MNHQELIIRAKRWLLKTNGCGFVLSELAYYNSSMTETPDVIGWKCGQSHLVECKASRADFFADRKKPFRRMPWRGLGRYRYFLTVPGLVSVGDLPHRWGLLCAYPKIIRIIKEPEYMPYDTIPRNEALILCSALRRVHLRGDLEKIYDMKTLGPGI